MRKHILGFALFSFIVVSFGLIFAFFYAPPNRKNEEFKQPILESDYRSSCRRKKPKKPKAVSSEIISSQFFLEENKVISQIKLTWNGEGTAPHKVFLETTFYSSENFDKKLFTHEEVFSCPFEGSTVKTLTIVSKGPANFKVKKEQNLYVTLKVANDFEFSNGESSGIEESEDLFEPKQVLFIYGNSSIINQRKTGTGSGRTDILQ